MPMEKKIYIETYGCQMKLNTDAMTHLHINAFPSAGVYLLRLGSQSQKIVIR